MNIAHRDSPDQSGYSVSGGFDMNSDGLSDFIIGAPEGGTIGEFDGEAYIVFGQVRKAGMSDSGKRTAITLPPLRKSFFVSEE